MIQTIERAVHILNEIQQRAIKGYTLTNNERSLWKEAHKFISSVGHKVVKHRTPHPEYKHIWYSVKSVNETNSPWVRYAPPCDHKNECTTRALFFCLNETIPYDSIRKEQNRKARARYNRGYCYGWNTREIWETVLTDRGFVKVSLVRTIRRDRLAKMLKNHGKILTHSSRHCASIHEGKVFDSWDSSRGRVDYILVRKEFEDEVKRIVGVGVNRLFRIG